MHKYMSHSVKEGISHSDNPDSQKVYFVITKGVHQFDNPVSV